MSDPTPPAVSEAMREAVAQWLRDRFQLNGWQSTAQAIALLKSGPIASEIARLTGERDAAAVAMKFARHEETLERRRAEAAEAETARLRAALEAAQGHAISLEQCALFVDSPPLRRSMTEAAGYLRALTSQEKTDA